MTRIREAPRITPEAIGELGPVERIVFVDSRGPASWAASKLQIPRSLRVPLDQADALLPHVPKGHPVVVYCDEPNDICSREVALRMAELGFGNAYALHGGFAAWQRAGLPTTTKGARMGEAPVEDTPPSW